MCHLLEVLGSEKLDGLGVPVLGHVLGEQVGLELLVEIALHESLDVLERDARMSVVWLVLDHLVVVVGHEAHERQVASLDAKEVHVLFVDLVVGVDAREHDLAAEELGSLAELLHILVEVVVELAHEQLQVDVHRLRYFLHMVDVLVDDIISN